MTLTAPERPFPAAPQDTEDVVDWVYSQSDRFDTNKLSLGGFSAGGNLALGLACRLVAKGKSVKAVVAMYPPVLLRRQNGRPSVAPNPHPEIGMVLKPPVTTAFDRSYLLPQVDGKNSDASPLFKPADQFPKVRNRSDMW